MGDGQSPIPLRNWNSCVRNQTRSRRCSQSWLTMLAHRSGVGSGRATECALDLKDCALRAGAVGLDVWRVVQVKESGTQESMNLNAA